MELQKTVFCALQTAYDWLPVTILGRAAAVIHRTIKIAR